MNHHNLITYLGSNLVDCLDGEGPQLHMFLWTWRTYVFDLVDFVYWSPRRITRLKKVSQFADDVYNQLRAEYRNHPSERKNRRKLDQSEYRMHLSKFITRASEASTTSEECLEKYILITSIADDISKPWVCKDIVYYIAKKLISMIYD